MIDIEKLFGDLSKDTQVENPQPKEEPKVEEPKEPEEPRKNRRHRRLEEQLENERRANIELNERLKNISQPKPSTATDIPTEWIALYGDTPEAQKAWRIQESLMEKHGEKVREQTLREIENRQKEEERRQRDSEAFIDSKLELLEDEHGIDLTSNAPAARKARREFLEMVEKFSPKDTDGRITGYADFDSVFEHYNKQKPSENANRAKEIASKSMQRSSSTKIEGTDDDVGVRWLKENRII